MPKWYDALDEDLRGFIAEQHVFFVATAPADGRINLSPKGMDTLRVLDDRTVAYLDLTGSGNETAAHVEENGRMTIMLTSFARRTTTLRLYGRARRVPPTDVEWPRLFPLFEPLPSARQIFVLHIESIQTSCGYSIPLYEFREVRQTLRRYWEQQTDAELHAFKERHNTTSIDGRCIRHLVQPLPIHLR